MQRLVIRAFSNPSQFFRTFFAQSSIKKLPTCQYSHLVASLSSFFQDRFELVSCTFLTFRLKWYRMEDYVGRFGDHEYFDNSRDITEMKKNHKNVFAWPLFFLSGLLDFFLTIFQFIRFIKRTLHILSFWYLCIRARYFEEILLQ